MEQYGVNSIKELLIYPIYDYQEMSPESIFYLLSILILFISGDSETLKNFNNFKKEFEEELFKYIDKDFQKLN